MVSEAVTTAVHGLSFFSFYSAAAAMIMAASSVAATAVAAAEAMATVHG